MKTEKLENGFAVEFPFELKDAFRRAFPSAKWNRDKKRWEVGPRSGNRLNQWVAEVESAARKIETLDQKMMDEQELAALRQEISMLIERRKHAESENDDALTVRIKLEAAKKELQQVRTETELAEKAMEDSRAKVTRLLSEVVDLDEIREQAAIMARNMDPANRQKKNRFAEAKAVVKKHRDALHDAGFVCRAISELASANVNRPDRDHPKYISQDDWFAIWDAED